MTTQEIKQAFIKKWNSSGNVRRNPEPIWEFFEPIINDLLAKKPQQTERCKVCGFNPCSCEHIKKSQDYVKGLATKENGECTVEKCVHHPKDESCKCCLLNPTKEQEKCKWCGGTSFTWYDENPSYGFCNKCAKAHSKSPPKPEAKRVEKIEKKVECHCGKDGHALNSVNCPVHGYKEIKKFGPCDFEFDRGSVRTALYDFQEKINELVEAVNLLVALKGDK